MIEQNTHAKDWKAFQERLKTKAKRRRFAFRAALLFAYLALIGGLYGGSRILAQGKVDVPDSRWGGRWENMDPERFLEKDLSAFIAPLNLDTIAETENPLHVVNEEGKFAVEVSLDMNLQKYILKLLRRSQTLQSAVIVLRPKNGQILAMTNYDKDGKTENLCLKADFPAASLFKIVSAAAVVEARGFTPEKTMAFKGMKHTLYKSQLNRDEGPYSTKTTFKRAFSGSVNPVFGKIGIYDLGKTFLSEYADKFLFNREIPFDLPLAASHVCIPDDDFGLAEVASGFNRKTLISPLHASLITAAIANYGMIVKPWLVRRIKDESGEILYRARCTRLGKAIEEVTAGKLRILMKDTVLNGTCRKAFLPLSRQRLFQDIELGAKTGTINDLQDQYKYDWVTAYALPKDSTEAVCVTVLAIHGKKLGIRASEIARYIIQHQYTS
jgi:peptidoglycan glycosyltransferase